MEGMTKANEMDAMFVSFVFNDFEPSTVVQPYFIVVKHTKTASNENHSYQNGK
jgi:hypothetical protein